LRKEERTYKMFLDDIQTAMVRIAEYIKGYDFEHFKRDYKTVDAVIRNFVFKDFKTQASAYFHKVNFNNIDCYGKRVFVSTIFGKDGKVKNTRIIKSANPICDSIAFNFICGLKD
jgi:hypothetical protein